MHQAPSHKYSARLCRGCFENLRIPPKVAARVIYPYESTFLARLSDKLSPNSACYGKPMRSRVLRLPQLVKKVCMKKTDSSYCTKRRGLRPRRVFVAGALETYEFHRKSPRGLYIRTKVLFSHAFRGNIAKSACDGKTKRSSVLRSLLLFATFSFKKKKLSVLSLQGKREVLYNFLS